MSIRNSNGTGIDRNKQLYRFLQLFEKITFKKLYWPNKGKGDTEFGIVKKNVKCTNCLIVVHFLINREW